MLKDKIQDVFNEPGCDINKKKSEKDRKKGCSKPLTPGAAAGGCAFDGAKIVLQPITDAAHLVHGPIACEGNSWDNRHAYSSDSKLYRTGMTTDMSEMDVIYGGEKHLWKSIKEVIERFDPPAVFVYQTCVPAMIGDDIVKVCKTATEKFNKPVIPVEAPGFVGSKSLGNKLAGEALLDYVIGTAEPEFTTDTDINIIGDYNLVGELWQVEPLFKKLGIRILGRMTGDAKYHEIASAHRARVNLMICSQAMVNVGRKMQERYGIPYYEGSFYGVVDMSETLRNISRLLVERGGPADLMERTEALIAEEEARVTDRLAYYKTRLNGKRVLLNTGGVKSWSVVQALQDCGMIITQTAIKKSTEEDKEKIKEIMGDDAHMFDGMAPREMYTILKDSKADIMLSGGRSQFIALKAKTAWLDINQERHYAYAGYEGIIELVKELDKTLFNPVWEQVKAPAPWELAGSDSVAEAVALSNVELEAPLQGAA